MNYVIENSKENYMQEFYQNRVEPYKAYLVKDYEFTSHLHNQLEIVYSVSGYCEIIIDGISYRLSKNDVAIIFPFQLHNLSKPENCKLLVQIFSPHYAKEYIPFLGSHIPKHPIVTNIHEDISYAIEKAYVYYIQSKSPQIIASYVSVFMNIIMEHLVLIPSYTSDCHNILHNLLKYIDEHFTENITLETLSHEFHVTRFYISRIFNQKLHSTFTDYLSRLRIEYAQELLKKSTLSISEIVFESGFESERTFFRLFRNQVKSTPLQYRKSISVSPIITWK